MSRSRIEAVVVLIPAYNEVESIRSCIESVRRATSALPGTVDVEVLVVANGCDDGTEREARLAGAGVIVVPEANVGAARAAGAAWALQRYAPRTDRLWIATTDADSVVPSDWLVAQLASAAHGADVFVGTVRLGPTEMVRHGRWLRKYTDDAARHQTHGHVHGANLGVRACAYVDAGGFRPMTAHEDVDLVDRLLRNNALVAWVADAPVLTSARHTSRAPAGLGRDLAASE